MLLKHSCTASIALLALSAVSVGGTSFASPRHTSEMRAAATESADAHIVDVVAITEVFADGLKISAVAIQYDRNIREASLKPANYTVTTGVPAQKILRVYTSTDGLQTSRRGLNGPYVILELSTDYIIPVPDHKMPPPMPPAGGAPQAQGPRPAPPKEEVKLNSEVLTTVGNITWEPAAHPASLKSSKHGGNGSAVSVTQVGSITATDGTTLTATSAAKDNIYVHNLIVDGFMKPDFTVGTHGNVKYNIHFPVNYDPGKKYPVVFFLDDSFSPTSFTHAEYLTHGQGATIWASKEDEARHPAIIVVPALSRSLVEENGDLAVQTRPGGQTSTPYSSILELAQRLPSMVPSMDTSRIYLTGQGDGARAGMRMMADDPKLFAAALLFSPDYDADKVAPLARSKMWIVVSEGDPAASTSTEKFVASLKASGARVGEATWNGQDTAAFAPGVRALASGGNNIELVVLKKGTVVPTGVPDDALNNHAYTWRIGYTMPALRDWLLMQK